MSMGREDISVVGGVVGILQPINTINNPESSCQNPTPTSANLCLKFESLKFEALIKMRK